jgi:hypothetical protein
MNKLLLLCALAALAAFGQSQTPLTITQSAGSATGELRMQERRTNGQDYVGIRAPQSVAANTVWTLPSADGTSGQCLQTDGSGQWGWAACIINGGNTTGATLTIGTNDAQTLSLETNGTGRWSIPITGHLYAGANNTYDIGAGLAANSPRSIYAATSIVTPKIGRDTSASFTIMTDSADRWVFNSAGMLYPAAHDTYDAGLTGTRIRGVYAKFGEFFKSGSTASSDYLETRKYKFKDATGSTGSWDMQADVTATVSQLFSRDNAGDPFRYSVRQSSGSPVNYEILYASLIPEKRNTGLGHSVTDATFPKLGTSSQPWSEIWGTNGDFAGDLTIDGTTVANVLNYASGTMTGTMKPLFGGTGSIGASGYSYGAAFFTASGFTLTDTTTVGYVWTATSTGGAGSWQAASGGLPVVDTTGIAKGSSDATKIVRFEVDGFTSGVTNVLTPQNNSYTLAGTNIAQTFSSTQTFSGTLAVSGTVGDDFIPNSNGTYVNGTTSFRWGSIATYNADFNGVLTLQSGSTITGSILPTTNNLYALGNTSYRMSNVATVNMNLSGTVTAPNGNTGLSSIRTVGDGSGGSCTITISGGIITASTCP